METELLGNQQDDVFARDNGRINDSRRHSIFDRTNMAFLSVLNFVFFYVILQSTVTGGQRVIKSSLKDKHVVYSGMPTMSQFILTRNASGHIVHAEGIGPNMMDWLSRYYGFTYSILQVNDTPFDSYGADVGLISYLTAGKCDVLVSASVTLSRYKLIDFTQPCSYLPVGYLIPKPMITANVASVIQPFSYEVWILLIGSVMAVILMLHFLNKRLASRNNSEALTRGPLRNVSVYVLSLLVYQPQSCTTRRFSLRWTVGIWCLATFVLANAYTCLLISFVTSPIPKPLIQSIYEVGNRPDVRVITLKGTNLVAILMGAENGFLKQLGDKLKSYPKSICANPLTCVEMVKSGSHVYMAAAPTYLATSMKTDYAATKHCNLEMGKEYFTGVSLPWGVQKRSIYTTDLNNGINKMLQAGFLDLWMRRFKPDVSQCVGRHRGYIKLTLMDLTGAFVLLFVGYVVSFLVYTFEKLWAHIRKTSVG